MIKYTKHLWLPVLFTLSCSASSHREEANLNLQTFDYSEKIQTLEKKLDDLSRTIFLLVNDGNRIHNKIDKVNTSQKDVLQKTESLEISLKNAQNGIGSLRTYCENVEGNFAKQIEDLQKAEIELLNRLELMKIERKEMREEKNLPVSGP
ncbi:MAG: hypothetical protein MRJ65_05615 [Candidatus Brocadiaceae bacterium]|nr:hypothetical protein [Candidatus Brocadiaceae bacterium]